MNYKLKIITAFTVIYCIFCFLSLNRHSHSKPFTYHSELWADKAGYNVYLPAVFIYNTDTGFFPGNLVSKTGYGFEIDSLSHKVISKYPYGVALLQSPFWLGAHLLSPDKTGYSFYYQKSIDLSGCFYLTLGLFFLFFTLRDYNSFRSTLFILFMIAFSTGIFYYGIFDSGMSHIYSFCCMAGIIYVFFKKNLPNLFYKFLGVAFLSTLFIVVRPVNLIFLIPTLCFLLYYSEALNFSDLKKLSISKISFIMILCILIILPQLLYYKYAFGSFFSNSYHKEPFFFPSLNRITALLFSADNGLLIYYPVISILLVFYFLRKTVYTKLSVLLLIVYILLYASWWSLSLGCGFGHRAINDIILVFFLPLCFSGYKLSKPFIIIFCILVIINIKFMFSFDGCLYSRENYNYTQYTSILFGEFK